MPIRIEHGKPSTIVSAAKKAGKAVAKQRAAEQAQRVAQQAMAAAARLQEKQMELDYRNTLRQQDMAIDLQMQERAKMWEIQKMELRSQVDFQREEQQRLRKLDSFDSALQQIDKEVLAGRMTEEEAYPLKLKYEMNKMGVDAPTSLLPTGGEDAKFGVDPYWMRGREAPEGTPERQLYEAKMEQQISGERRGVVPYYLDPVFIGNYPEAARQAQEARGIFLSDEEFESIKRGTAELPLAGKQLDVGVRTERQEGVSPLSAAVARQILIEAGGDRDKARQIARQRGYSF
jgi:hypothetical protein